MITQDPEEVRDMNRELVSRFYDLAFVEHDLRRAGELMAPDYIIHDPTLNGGRLSGVDAWKKLQGYYFKLIPDHQFMVHDQIAENDKVTTRWSVKGTENGQCFDITGITITRVQDGMVAEEWQDWDSQGFYRQIGKAPELRKVA
jgi:predicted ester cyclase